MIISVIAIALTFLLVVGIHELGHALAAQFFRVGIQQISLGFGKPVFCWQSKKGIQWTIGRWPLGGYVRLLNSRFHPVHDKDHSLCFNKKPLWIQSIILAAGGLMNFFFAIIALIIFYFLGFTQQIPVVLSVIPHSIMDNAGLKAGDRILQMDKKTTENWADVGMILAIKAGQKSIPLRVSTPNAEIRTLFLNLKKIPWSSKKTFIEQFGMEMDKSRIHEQSIPGLPIFQAARQAINKLGQLAIFFLILLKQLILMQVPFSLLLGPIGLLSLSIKTFLQGLALYSYFIATLSISVGLINLLPIPGLDGGSLLYLLMEKIRGKAFSIALEVLLYRLAFIVFIVLLVQLFLNDLRNFAEGIK